MSVQPRAVLVTMTKPATVVRVEIPGPPMAWARPKAQRHAAGIRFYEDGKRTSYRNLCAVLMKQAMGGRAPLDGALRLTLEAVFPCPAARRLKRSLRPTEPHAKKPDGSNLQKLVEDAGNGILWLDDSQIAEWSGRKRVGAQGEAPCVLLTVESLGGAP